MNRRGEAGVGFIGAILLLLILTTLWSISADVDRIADAMTKPVETKVDQPK